jgi:erythromycin esterase-like protein
VVEAAERFYRTADSARSWNLRDQHMFDTLLALLDAGGPGAKAVVWAHNTHVGNAAATEMAQRGELNIGELCRKHFRRDASLVGFGTDRGTVMAASQWDAPPEIKTVRPSLPDSYGALFREAHSTPFLLDLRPGVHEGLRQGLMPERLERAIGVMYLPESERQSHYFDASLPEQFDGFLFYPETRAVTPITDGRATHLPGDHPFAG